MYEGGFIGDTPGFSKLSLLGISKEELPLLFKDFKVSCCKFKDCNHKENILGCQIREDSNNGTILKSRYENYLRMYKEIEERK